MSGRYVPFSEVFESIFYRMLMQAGITKPREVASSDDLAAIMQAYTEMEMRLSANECIQKVRQCCLYHQPEQNPMIHFV